ncbi:hypothetical protein B0H16DRAFT_1750252 [Mycena metata]|uniref:Uncharacterized protein n=1 Tax=Mycena metata TaxID=1033252 RepID=A0AAD7DQ82_9AGAR|nr:hypothetical protein B0H16DRAFT_1750252 [Mycena metata]
MTLRVMIDLYGGRIAEGVYGFLSPISYRYTERNARSRSAAIEIALRSRDVFLLLMAQIILMFILLDARDPKHWRDQLQGRTKLHWQWMTDLERSAVGDMFIDCLGGIIDLTLAKRHANHFRWLLPHLLGKHRVPLYFFYGKAFPFKEPIPDPLLAASFWPDADELEYLRSLDGRVVFSPWSVSQSRSSNSGAKRVYTSLRNGAPLPSPCLAPSVLAAPFTAVEPGSDQKEGEDVHAFMERRRLHNEKCTAARIY